MKGKTPQSYIVTHFCWALLLVTFAALLLYNSWYKWPDALVDYGRELYIPWQILNGKVLYRDIFHLFGPFGQYFNAMLFRFFGVGLSTLVTFNICCVVGVCIMLGYLQRRMFGWFATWISLFVFIGVFAFGQYRQIGNFNFICPYSHDAIYGLELSLLMFVCLWRLYDRREVYCMGTLGMLMGLIFLTKVEIAISAWISATTVLVMLAKQDFRFRNPVMLGAWLCGVTAPLAAFYVWFMLAGGAVFALHTITINFLSPFIFQAMAKNVLYQLFSGFMEPAKNLRLLLFIGLLECFLLLCGLQLSRMSSFKAQLAGTIMVTLMFCLFMSWDFLPATKLLRPLPVALLIVCWKWNFNKPLHTGFAIFSLLLLLKILLNVNAANYGFFLAMPGAILMTGWVVHNKHWTLRVPVLTAIVFFIAAHVLLSQQSYASKGVPVGEGADRFITLSEQYASSHGRSYSELLPWLRSNIRPDEGMVVLPEGVMINYLARRQNPGKLFEFHPALVEAMGENQVLNLLQESDPAYILITDRETSIFGARFFGKDYGLNIAEWVNREYETVRVFGAEPLQDKGFGVKVLRRKEHNRSGNSARFKTS